MFFSDSTEALLQRSKKIPLLTPDEELVLSRLIRSYLEHPNPSPRRKYHYLKAKKKLIESNIRLVLASVRRYASRCTAGHTVDDIFQDGMFGLDRAAELFDYRRGYKFSTYSFAWIKQAIVRGIHNHARTIRLPSHTENFLTQYHRYQEQLYCVNAIQDFENYMLMHGRKDRPKGGTQARLQEIAAVVFPLSLDARFNENTENELGDVLCDEKSDGRNTLEAIARQEEYDQIKATMLEVLTESERGLIEKYYLRGASSLKLADEYGISSSTIRMKVHKAMDKLRQALGVSQPAVAA